jgi:hypothetical protein
MVKHSLGVSNNNAPDDMQCDDSVIVEIVEGEITEQMRAAYDRFWQLLIGRLINEGKLQPERTKVTTRTTKR